MSHYTFYQSTIWRRLARQAKERDGYQCQICGDRLGDPYCQIQAHHRIPRSKGGPDTLDNLITLCDLCHAVVTKWWYSQWFGSKAITDRDALDQTREDYTWFISLEQPERSRIQREIWPQFGERGYEYSHYDVEACGPSPSIASIR